MHRNVSVFSNYLAPEEFDLYVSQLDRKAATNKVSVSLLREKNLWHVKEMYLHTLFTHGYLHSRKPNGAEKAITTVSELNSIHI